jgi:hypothetical protein
LEPRPPYNQMKHNPLVLHRDRFRLRISQFFAGVIARLIEPVKNPNLLAFVHLRRLSIAGGIALGLCLGGLRTVAGTVAYWRFEPGNLAIDSSGNGHDLNLNNVISSADVSTNAPGTGAATFDGSTSFGQTITALNLAEYKGLTIEAFIKTNGQSPLGMLYEQSADINANVGGFYLDLNEPGGQVKLAQRTAAGYAVTLPPYSTNSDWHHYAVRMDESGPTTTFSIYIDGVLAVPSSLASGGTIGFLNDIFNIGSRNGAAFFFDGQLDEIRISNKVLPPAGFLIARALTNASIIINTQPQNTTALQNGPATFTAGATLTNADSGLLDFQWQTNGIDIPGAIGSTYMVSNATTALSGMQYRVVISVQAVGGVVSVTSAPATLTVQADTTAPVALSTYAQVATMIGLRFNELLDPVIASDPTRYSVSGGVTVQSVQVLPDGKSVAITVDPLTAAQYNIAFTGIADMAGNLATNSITGKVATGFVLTDIGTITEPTILSATDSNGFTVLAGGLDIFGTADSFSYIYKSLTNDFDMRLQIGNITQAKNVSTRGGLMAREDTTPGARNVFVGTYPANNSTWVATERSTVDGGTAIVPNGYIPRSANISFPTMWVRLKRQGQTFTTYYGTNGFDWVQLGNSITDVALPDSILVGVASSSIDVVNGAGMQAAQFEYSNLGSFALTNAIIVIGTQPSNREATENGTATFTVAATLQNGPQSALGYQWQRDGVDIVGATGASYTFVPSLPDNGIQYRVRVLAPGVNPLYSAPAALTVHADTQIPSIISTAGIAGNSIGVRFDGALDPVTAADVSRYTLAGGIGIDSAVLQPDQKTVVLGVSGLSSAPYTFQVSGVKDLAGNPATLNVTGEVLNYAVQDIGSLNAPSLVYAVALDAIEARVDGGAIWFNADSGNLINQPKTGDFDVRVQVSKVAGGNANSNMMLDARKTSDAGSRHVAITVYPTQKNWTAFTRSSTDGGSGVLGGNWRIAWPAGIDFPNVWLRLVRNGNIFTTYGGTNGVDWIQVGDPYIPDPPYTDNTVVGMSTAVTDAGQPPIQVEYRNFGTPVEKPQLHITAAANSTFLISWAATATGFQLQSSSQLGTGANWTQVTPAPTVSGNSLQVTVPAADAARFFRLGK